MSITTTKYAFNTQNVAAAPNTAGVYGLYDANGATIYYGSSSVSIRSRLQSHLSGNEGPCTKGASQFNYECTSTPVARERQLLQEHKRNFGRLPRCNNVIP